MTFRIEHSAPLTQAKRDATVEEYTNSIDALENNRNPQNLKDLTDRVIKLQQKLEKTYPKLSRGNQEEFITQKERLIAVLNELTPSPKEAAPAIAQPQLSEETEKVTLAKVNLLDREINFLRETLSKLSCLPEQPKNANEILSKFNEYLHKMSKIGNTITALQVKEPANQQLLNETYAVLAGLHNEVLAKIKQVKPEVVRLPEEPPIMHLLPPPPPVKKPPVDVAKEGSKTYQQLCVLGSKVQSYVKDNLNKLGSSVYRSVWNQYAGAKGLMRGALDIGLATTIYSTSGHLDNPYVAASAAVLVPTLAYARSKVVNASGKKQAPVQPKPAPAAAGPSLSAAPVQLDARQAEPTQARAPHRFAGFDISTLSKRAPVAADPKPPEFVGPMHRFANVPKALSAPVKQAPAPAPVPQGAVPVLQYVAVDEPPSPDEVDQSFEALLMMQEGAQPLGAFKWGNRAVQVDLAPVDVVAPPKKTTVLDRVTNVMSRAVNALLPRTKRRKKLPPIIVPASTKDDKIVLKQNKPAPQYAGFRELAEAAKSQQPRLFAPPEEHKEQLKIDVNEVRPPAELDLHNLDYNLDSNSDDDNQSVASDSAPLKARLEPESDDEKTHEID